MLEQIVNNNELNHDQLRSELAERIHELSYSTIIRVLEDSWNMKHGALVRILCMNELEERIGEDEAEEIYNALVSQMA